MKTKAFFFMVCIWLLTTNGFAQNTIKGDGNIITKEISISDYDEISYVGKVNIKYEQSNASPFFKITIDENILPHLDIKIKGKTLIIQPKNEKKYFKEKEEIKKYEKFEDDIFKDRKESFENTSNNEMMVIKKEGIWGKIKSCFFRIFKKK